MFKKTLITLTAAAVLTAGYSATASARDGGGSDRPYAINHYPGEEAVSVGTNDGGRLLLKKKKNGKIKVRKFKKKGRSWATSRNTRTGAVTGSFGNGRGNPRTIITISPFGFIGIGFSN